MDRAKKEEWINKLLVFMNDEVENYGHGIQYLDFSFSEGQEDFNSFNKMYPIKFEEFSQVMNTCISRKYIKRYLIGGGGYEGLKLTESGQGRAISSLNQDKSLSEGNINIGTLNSNGIAQIGKNNTLNIENVLINLVEQIENSDATEGEKKEAKSRLAKFLEHPLVNTIAGTAVGTILSKMGI